MEPEPGWNDTDWPLVKSCAGINGGIDVRVVSRPSDFESAVVVVPRSRNTEKRYKQIVRVHTPVTFSLRRFAVGCSYSDCVSVNGPTVLA